MSTRSRVLAPALVLIAAAAAVTWRLAGQRGAAPADQPSPRVRAGADGTVARRTATELAPAAMPRFHGPALPAGFRRGEGARPHADDATLGRWLSSARPWQGEVPASLAELPATPLVRERRQEFANDSELDYRLRLLAAIDRCVRGAGVSPGAAVAAFWFDVQADGDRARMVGKRVSVEATTLASKDDDAFQGCLSTAHVGTGFVREGPPEPSEHVWPTTLPVPVKNHELFRWLLSKGDG